MDKSNKIIVISSIILAGFVFGVIYHYVLGFYLGLGDPFNTFLFAPNSAFCDFTKLVPFITKFAPFSSTSMWVNYFPLAYILLFPFTFIQNKLFGYLIFIAGFLTFWIFMNIKTFSCKELGKIQNFRNIFIISTMCYPVLFVLDRGNFDMYLFIILALCVYAFKSEKYMLSAFLLAIENAIKPFPILFLFLFLYKKRYKEFFFSLILTGILVIGGFMVLKGNFFDQIVVLLKNLMIVKSAYVYENDNNFGMTHYTSLFPAVKLLFCKRTLQPFISIFSVAKLYDYFMLFVTGLTIFFTWKEKVFWKQIALLTCNMLMVPYIVGDYKLIFLIIPIWLFVNAKEKSRFDLAYAILFSLLLIPKNIIIVTHLASHTASPFFSLSIIINPLLMVSIFCLIIFEQFRRKNQELKHD